MPGDRYARQRGLVAQDIVADARVALTGDGSALTYTLLCLVLCGFGTGFGHLRIVGADREVTEDDLAHQFLLRREDVGTPLSAAAALRVGEINPAVTLLFGDAPADRTELVLAVPAPDGVKAVAAAHAVDVWGCVLPAGVWVGRTPPPEAAVRPGPLTAALSGVCGGMVAQAALNAVGAVITGPTVTASWTEERLRVHAPGVGAAAAAAMAGGVPEPDLRGLLEQAGGRGAAGSFAIRLDGRPVRARVIAALGDDEVLAAAVVRQPHETRSPVRVTARRRPARLPDPVFWSPFEGVGPEDQVPVPERAAGSAANLGPATPASGSVLMCGAGALGSWAAATLAASRVAPRLVIVDMDEQIEAHNLNRQVLFAEGDIGLSKAERTAQRLRQIDPGLEFVPIAATIGPHLLGEASHVDPARIGVSDPARAARIAQDQERERALRRELGNASAVLSCPDNQQTRWTLNMLTESLGVPLVNGAVEGFAGRLHVCDPASDSMCLVCWLGESIAADPERASCTAVVDGAAVQSIVTSAAVIGCAQTAALIATLTGHAGTVRRYLVWDGAALELSGHRAGDRDRGECPDHLAAASPAA